MCKQNIILTEHGEISSSDTGSCVINGFHRVLPLVFRQHVLDDQGANSLLVTDLKVSRALDLLGVYIPIDQNTVRLASDEIRVMIISTGKLGLTEPFVMV